MVKSIPFKTWKAYRDYEHSILSNYRYIHDSNVLMFLNSVLATATKRAMEEQVNRVLYRAQIGTDDKQVCAQQETCGKTTYGLPHSKERMKPLPDRALEGRLNPKGIPCLYLAYSKETAISEIKPDVGAYVSLAEFCPTKTLNIIDCTNDSDTMPEMKIIALAIEGKTWEPPTEPTEIEKCVWSEINRAFAKPVSNGDHTAEYAPTQILAELFKRNGYDGIKFTSSVSEGYNLALFNPEFAKYENCEVQYIQKLNYKFHSAVGFKQHGAFHDIAGFGSTPEESS